MLPLSVAIITKNEEKRLPDCLKSVPFAGDIVVVDSGSSDRTMEIAKEAGCRVFSEEWKGYGPQRNSAIQKCKYDWVLSLDADERMPFGSKEIIERALEKPSAAAYSFRMKHFFHGKWLRHAGYWPDRHLVLLDRRRGTFEGVIHEKWMTDGEVYELDAHVDHYGFDNYSDLLDMLDDYSTQIAKGLLAKGKRANPLTPLTHGIATFSKIYLLQKGFLAGFDGLVIAFTKAGGSFFKYAKLLELQRENKG